MMGPDGSLLLLDRTNQRSFGDRNEGREQAASRGRANLRAQAAWTTRPWPERPGERSEQERETSVSYRRCAFFAYEDAVIKS